MFILKFTIKLQMLAVLICGFLTTVFPQVEPKNNLPNEPEETLTINTELIRTGVAVFDKKGKFISNLKPEDFELSVDGKPVSISFFNRNTLSKNGNPESSSKQNNETEKNTELPTNSAVFGRNIIFAVDDFHLSFSSHYRVKKIISKFIEQEMMPQDNVAIVSPTGKIGFLQQFTNDKTVLRRAVERLQFTRDKFFNDRLTPPMSEYEASLISRYDMQITDIFAAQEPGFDIESKRESVRSRALTILAQAAVFNRAAYSTLEQVIRNSAQLSGRKIILFFSDGFLLDTSNTDSAFRLKQITDAAARTNSVIYSFDANGLDGGLPESTTASTTAGFRVQAGERFESQDGLSLLAKETGGRFVRNTNDLQANLTNSVEEASQFYLLSWQPLSEISESQKFRKIEVRIKNHPEFDVRVQGGYLDKNLKADSEEKSKKKTTQDKNLRPVLSTSEQQLDAAAKSPVPLRTLPTSLSVNYFDTADAGMTTTIDIQIKSDAVEFKSENGNKASADIDLLGIIYDSDGKREEIFRRLLTVDTLFLPDAARQDIYHNFQTKLKPGLHQIRVAARDVKSGFTGSAVQWIEIPDLSKRKLELSSLILMESANGNTGKPENKETTNERVIVDRRILRTSRLRYLLFIYNAIQGKTGIAKPDVTVKTQVVRGKQILLTSPAHQISLEGQDLSRLQFAAEVPLSSLLPGFYELLVEVRDNNAKSDSQQHIIFEVR